MLQPTIQETFFFVFFHTSKVARAHARASYYKFCFEVLYIWVLIDFRFNFINIIHNERWNIYMSTFIVTKTYVCDVCWFTSKDKSYIIHSFLVWSSLVSGFILRHVVFLHCNISAYRVHNFHLHNAAPSFVCILYPPGYTMIGIQVLVWVPNIWHIP
jgi:hypothetical protein